MCLSVDSVSAAGASCDGNLADHAFPLVEQSGSGRELGEYALANYTEVKVSSPLLESLLAL